MHNKDRACSTARGAAKNNAEWPRTKKQLSSDVRTGEAIQKQMHNKDHVYMRQAVVLQNLVFLVAVKAQPSNMRT